MGIQRLLAKAKALAEPETQACEHRLGFVVGLVFSRVRWNIGPHGKWKQIDFGSTFSIIVLVVLSSVTCGILNNVDPYNDADANQPASRGALVLRAQPSTDLAQTESIEA